MTSRAYFQKSTLARTAQDYADAKTAIIRRITHRILQSYPFRTLTEKNIPEMRALFHNTILRVNIADYTAEEAAD